MSNLFQELKRRNVFRVAIAYAAITWLILQVSDIVLENIGAPAWVMQTLMFLLAIGFPIAVLFAWAYEMTPEGIKLEKDVDRSQSITQQTGQRLNRTIIVVLLAAVGFLLADKFMPEGEAPEVTAAGDRSVAVLPFVAMSSGENDEFFADGLTEEILNSLTRVPELLVTARTSAFHFKGQDIPIPEIAAELGVEHVVEGSVRRSGDQLRVTAQLIRAADGFHLWSETYDNNTEDTFGVQTDIAEKIASSLGVLLDEDVLAEMRSSGFRNPEAYVAYQKGLQLFNEAHNHWDIAPHLVEANVWFDRVIELEADASRAHLLRVDYYSHLLTDGYEELSEDEKQDTVRKFREGLDAAVRTASDPVSSVIARFDRALLAGRWREVHGILDEYSATESCPTAGWINILTLEFGRAQQVLDLSQRLTACDPKSPFGWWYTMQAYHWLGEMDAAVELGENSYAESPHATILNGLVASYIGAGRLDDAEYTFQNANLSPGDSAELGLSIAAARGDVEAVNAARAIMEEHRADRLDIQINYLARTGDREAANAMAAKLDAMPFGYLALMGAPSQCMCGAPWDIEVTPDFKKRIEDAGLSWPPASPITWPLKDW